jgi:predicted acetyltransferase
MSAGVSLRPVERDERVVLENLGQLYCYDWSELVPLDVGAEGRFAGLDLGPYWRDDWCHPFLIERDDRPAGFALIQSRSRLTGRAGVFDVAEFFVMRQLRRAGVGVAAAGAAFDHFRGPWEVRQRDENPAATAFWRRAIGDYTCGSYDERRWDGPEWTGLVQTFSSGWQPRT